MMRSWEELKVRRDQVRPLKEREMHCLTYYEIIDKEFLEKHSDYKVFCVMYMEDGEENPTGDGGMTYAEALRERDDYYRKQDDIEVLDVICVGGNEIVFID
jgi:hypothetical protein